MSDPTVPPETGFEDALVAAIPAVHRFARYLTRDAVRAEDLLQETYAQALVHRDQFALGTDCRAWLFKIAHNLHRKGQARVQRERPEDDATLEALAAAGVYAGIQGSDPVGRVFEGVDLLDALDRALEKLPDEYRAVVALVDLEDQSYADAARVLGLPLGTVRSRLFRARRLLQHDLLAHAQDAGLLRPPMEDRAR